MLLKEYFGGFGRLRLLDAAHGVARLVFDAAALAHRGARGALKWYSGVRWGT